MHSALTIVTISGITALIIGVLVGSLPLMATLVGSALLSLAYSVDLPLLRWKQYPVAAAACILAVRYGFATWRSHWPTWTVMHKSWNGFWLLNLKGLSMCTC